MKVEGLSTGEEQKRETTKTRGSVKVSIIENGLFIICLDLSHRGRRRMFHS